LMNWYFVLFKKSSTRLAWKYLLEYYT
jgi:hypothetical protein